MGDELKATLRSRDVISVARGMVMARKGLDSEGAYRHLVWLSRRARLPLSELAERMVAAPVRRDPPQDR